MSCPSGRLRCTPRRDGEVTVIVVALTIAALSYWPVRNMASPKQLMNYSFNPLRLANTYGLFGAITRTRCEVVIEGTDEAALGPETAWREYEFKAKPGDPRRRPRQVAPYHLRLDWLMWFVPLSPHYARGWFVAFLVKLLENDAATLRLLSKNPFPAAPRRSYGPASIATATPRQRSETAPVPGG
jgi:hypothetical protein